MGEFSDFDVLQYLARKRHEAKNKAQELLWENVKQSIHWGNFASEDSTAIAKRKVVVQFNHFHPALVALQTAFTGTVTNLEAGEVQNILQYGGARRIGSIYRAVKRTCEIAYLDRQEVMSLEDSQRLSESLLLIYVHMIGVFDSLSIAMCRLGMTGQEYSERNADLLKPSFRKVINNANLDTIVGEHDAWFTRIKDQFRNRYVHRVPPYVAPSVLSKEEEIEYNELQVEYDNALREGRISDLETIQEKKDDLGSFFPYISFIDSDEHVHLLPTVLDDALRFQFITLSVFEEMIPRLRFRAFAN